MTKNTTAKKVIKDILKSNGWNQLYLAERMGLKGQSGVASRLSENSMRVDTLINFIETLGYEVVIKSKDGKIEHRLTFTEEPQK